MSETKRLLSLGDFVESLDFVDIEWAPYNALKYDKQRLKEQVDQLYYTGLAEPNGGLEFTFVPTKKMQKYEEIIKELYSKLQVVNNSVNICNEVFYTSKIEGAQTTLVRTQQLHDGEYINANNAFSEYMVLGGFNATKYMNIISNRVQRDTMRTCWEILTESCCNNVDIKGDLYRIGTVQVGGHVGLNHLLLEEMMDSWIAYHNSTIKLDKYPFIKAVFLHYTFESIHPFCDGNGRMGRLLMSNYLISKGFDKLRAVSFSRSIEKDITAYNNAFNVSDNVYSDCTFFIEYMLLRMIDALEDCIE